MSDADRINVAYVEETTFGVTPSGPAPTLQNVRLTSESLKQATTTVSSAEIRPDRQINDVVRTVITGEGDIGIELSYGAFDDFFEATLQSSGWAGSATVGPIATISFESIATSSTSFAKIKDSGSGFGSLVVGQWIKVRGAGTAANNVYAKIEVASAAEIEISGTDLVDEVAGASVTVVQGDFIDNGTTQRSFSFEREFTDLASEFAVHRGMTFASMSLTVAADALISGTFTLNGKDEISAAATAGDGSNTAAPTNEVMSAVDSVVSILEDLAAFSSTGFSLELTNNLRNRLQIGELGPDSIGSGTVSVSGTLQAFFESKTTFDKYLNFDTTSLGLVVEDSAGNAYVFFLPKVKFSDGARVAGGQNTDIIADLSWEAFRDPTLGITLRITRFAAP